MKSILNWTQKYYFLAMLLIFFVSFLLPVSTKTVNNIFYAGLACPILVWFFLRPLLGWSLLSSFLWVLVPLLFVAVLTASEAHDLKVILYLFSYFVLCIYFAGREALVKKAIALFSLIVLGVFFYIVVDWAFIWFESGVVVRYQQLFGVAVNPVYLSIIIVFSLVYLWVFTLDDWFSTSSRFLFFAGFLCFCSLVLLCVSVFQSRSTLLGFILFYIGYIWFKRIIWQGFALGIGVVFSLYLLGVDALLSQRALSYRPEIWFDAATRLINECSVLIGCGKDNYFFLGEFHHAHSGFLSVFYQAGLLGGGAFLFFMCLFFFYAFRARSRWMCVSLIGWGSLLTTTNGVFISPQPLWIYFWFPVFMAVLELKNGFIESYYVKRGGLCLSSF